MENKTQVGLSIPNIGPRKVEVKSKPGALVHRSILGNLRSRNVVQKDNKNPIPKKEPIPAVQRRTISLRSSNVKQEKQVEKKESEQNTAKVETSVVPSYSTKSLPNNIKDIDEEDKDNPQLVSDYVKDIYSYLWKLENENSISEKYLEGSKITSRMRSILIDWLVQVHLKFTLLPETLYLTVAIIDRYLQVEKVIKERLQLVGVAAMYVACKYEEMYIPEIDDFVYITDKSFTKKEIRLMEIDILKKLKFFLGFPLPLHFLRRDSKAGSVDAVHHGMAKYFMELTLTEYSCCHLRASMVAAASLYLALKLTPIDCIWDDTIEHYCGYAEKDILPVVHKIASIVIKASTNKTQTIRVKYRHAKLLKVSEMKELSPANKTLTKFASNSENFLKIIPTPTSQL